jgi:hypothetical protein
MPGDEIDAILQRYDEAVSRVEHQKLDRAVARAALAGEFKRIRAEIIKPALEALRKRLQPRGDRVEIAEDKHTVDASLASKALSIALTITPAPIKGAMPQSTEPQTLAFIAYPAGSKTRHDPPEDCIYIRFNDQPLGQPPIGMFDPRMVDTALREALHQIFDPARVG